MALLLALHVMAEAYMQAVAENANEACELSERDAKEAFIPFSRIDAQKDKHTGRCERLLCRDDARMLLLASHAVAEACRQAIAEKVEGAHEVSEKDAAEAVCQVFTNSLEYEPAMPVATACAGSAALQGVIPCRLHQERIACRDLGYKTTRRFAYSTGDGSLKLNSPRTRTKSHY